MQELPTDNVVKPTRSIEYYQASDGKWYWRVKNISNKKIVLTGAEGYHNKGNVVRAINSETKNWVRGSFIEPVEVKNV